MSDYLRSDYLREQLDEAQTAIKLLMSDYDKVLAELDLVKALHQPVSVALTGRQLCRSCNRVWPCPTSHALTEKETA